MVADYNVSKNQIMLSFYQQESPEEFNVVKNICMSSDMIKTEFLGGLERSIITLFKDAENTDKLIQILTTYTSAASRIDIEPQTDIGDGYICITFQFSDNLEECTQAAMNANIRASFETDKTLYLPLGIHPHGFFYPITNTKENLERGMKIGRAIYGRLKSYKLGDNIHVRCCEEAQREHKTWQIEQVKCKEINDTPQLSPVTIDDIIEALKVFENQFGQDGLQDVYNELNYLSEHPDEYVYGDEFDEDSEEDDFEPEESKIKSDAFEKQIFRLNSLADILDFNFTSPNFLVFENSGRYFLTGLNRREALTMTEFFDMIDKPISSYKRIMDKDEYDKLNEAYEDYKKKGL